MLHLILHSIFSNQKMFYPYYWGEEEVGRFSVLHVSEVFVEKVNLVDDSLMIDGVVFVVAVKLKRGDVRYISRFFETQEEANKEYIQITQSHFNSLVY